jgi:hypothetical protein
MGNSLVIYTPPDLVSEIYNFIVSVIIASTSTPFLKKIPTKILALYFKLVVVNHPKLAKGQRDSGEVERSSLRTRFLP